MGKFSGTDVRFHGKLKKPVFARRPGSVTANNATTSPALSGRPIFSSPTPYDPSSSPFHLDKNDSEIDINTPEQGPSEQSHSHGTASYEHGYSSRSNTRPSSADKSPGSDSSSIETPARPSEDHQAHQMGVEVFDSEVNQPRPLSNQSRQNPISRDARAKGPASEDTESRYDDTIDERSSITRPGSGPFSLETTNIAPENKGIDRSGMREERVPTQMGRNGALDRVASVADEPYSPSSEYTKEGGLASEDSHIQRESTVSDGGFGIGLSLLQGLANGDRDSRNWSESETDIESSFPKPPTQNQPRPTETVGTRRALGGDHAGASSNAPDALVPPRKYSAVSAVSESDAGDGGFQWDDDDLLDDYRYSRYSLSSKTSKQSRSSTVPSVTRTFQAAPPLPEDGRPSLDGQSSSSRSASSPQPYSRSSLLVPAPLNIVKNNARDLTPSPTTPVPYGNRSHEDSSYAKETPTRNTFERQGSTDDEEAPQDTNSLRPPQSQEITPKPSNETLTLRTESLDKVTPSTSTDYNGDESEPDDSPSVEAEGVAMLSPGPLSPSSTTRSTSSMFLPHPGAPKPLMDNKGQIAPRTAAIHIAIARTSSHSGSHDSHVSSPEAEQPKSPVLLSIPTAVSLISMLAMAAERARKVKQTTVYGTTQVDLLSSPGPVPIAFSLEGHPPSPRGMHDSDFGFPRQSPVQRAPASPVGLGFPSAGADGKTSPAPAQAVPRANFFPANGRPRPRSRSFSGFSINDAEVLIPAVTRQVLSNGC